MSPYQEGEVITSIPDLLAWVAGGSKKVVIVADTPTRQRRLLQDRGRVFRLALGTVVDLIESGRVLRWVED